MFKSKLQLTLCLSIGALLPAQLSLAISATTLSSAFTYQGKFLTPDGTQPMTDVVNVTLGIYSADGQCLLYEEKQNNVDLSATAGLFSLKVGSATGDPKRTARDPGKILTQIFSNLTTALRADDTATTATCIGGYTPAAGDTRLLKVTIYSQGTGRTETLSPDLSFGPVPQASVAETLQGLGVDDFIHASGNVSQSALGTLTSCAAGGACTAVAADASGLHHHDSLYTRSGSSTPQNLGTGGTYTSGTVGAGTASAPTGVQMEVKAINSSTKGLTIQGAAGQAVNYLEIKDSSGNVLLAFDKDGKLSTSGQFSSVNGATIGYPLGTAGPVNGLAVSGNVGIGVTGPTYKLDVEGVIRARSGNKIFASSPDNTTNYISIYSTNTGAVIDQITGPLDMHSLRLAWGLDASGGASTILSNDVENARSLMLSTSNSKDIYFTPGGNSVFSSGNVGIGTTSPSGILDVRGGTAAASTSGTNIQLMAQNAGPGNRDGGSVVLMPGVASGTGSPGGVGINTTSLMDNSKSYAMAIKLPSTAINENGGVMVTNNQSVDAGKALLAVVNYGITDSYSSAAQKPKNGHYVGSYFFSSLDYASHLQNPSGSSVLHATQQANNLSYLNQNLYYQNNGRTNASGRQINSQSYFYLLGSAANPASLFDATGYLSRAQFATTYSSIGTLSDFRASNIIDVANGTITNRYGLHIDFDNTSVTNAYGVYQSSSTLKNYFNGNVGIGTTGPTTRFHVVDGVGELKFQNSNQNNLYVAGTNASVVVDAVGSTYPGYFIKTEGAIKGQITTNSGSNTDGMGLYVAGTANGIDIRANGFVGIGTSNPGYKLDIQGTGDVYGKILSTNSGTAGLYLNSWLSYTDPVNTSAGLVYSYSGSEKMRLSSVGNLGIGTTGPSYKLQVGNAADGTEARANAWNTLSDERLKREFSAIDDSLEKVLQIGGYTYYWKDSPDKARKMGVKAQEVERVFPEVVSTGSDGFKSVSYNHLIAPVIEAIKSLAAKWSSDHDEIGLLKKNFKHLKDENAAIKAENNAIKEWACSQDQSKEPNRRPAFCK